MRLPQTVEKVPLGLFRRTSQLRARLRKRSVAYTLAGIEVFFASAELRQKTDFKSPLRGQIRFFRQAACPRMRDLKQLFSSGFPRRKTPVWGATV